VGDDVLRLLVGARIAGQSGAPDAVVPVMAMSVQISWEIERTIMPLTMAISLA
jgi:hypothetical protein